MSTFPCRMPLRQERLDHAASHRVRDLILVLENLRNDWNVNAILRTAEGAGLLQLAMVTRDPLQFHRGVSFESHRWLELQFYPTIDQAYQALRQAGFRIYCTTLASRGSRPFWDVSFLERCAIVLGNESAGLTPEAVRGADARVWIPMLGLTRSLNVSVAAGVLIYEALRQRRHAGQFPRQMLHVSELYPGERE